MPRKADTRSQRNKVRRMARTQQRRATMERQRITVDDAAVTQEVVEEAKEIAVTTVANSGDIIQINNGDANVLLEQEIQDLRSRLDNLETP